MMTDERIASRLNVLGIELDKMARQAERERTQQAVLSVAAYLYDAAADIAAHTRPCPGEGAHAPGNGGGR